MEKRGVISPGNTPAEHEEAEKAAQDIQPKHKEAVIEELDSDFRKRAADAASN